MNKNVLFAALGGGIVGAALVGAGLVLSGGGGSGDMVRQQLLANPEMLIEAQQALRDKQTKPFIDANRELIETPFESSVQGAEDPAVTVVEFYDYACGYCRQAKPDLDRLLAEEDDVRIVYRELPVLGPNSIVAARASLAASKAGRFVEFHDKLYELGSPNEENITAALESVGLGMDALADPAFEAELKKNFELANALGASGTPLFVIGDRIINSADGYAAYKQAVDTARENRSS